MFNNNYDLTIVVMSKLAEDSEKKESKSSQSLITTSQNLINSWIIYCRKLASVPK